MKELVIGGKYTDPLRSMIYTLKYIGKVFVIVEDENGDESWNTKKGWIEFYDRVMINRKGGLSE